MGSMWAAAEWRQHAGINALADLLSTPAFTGRVAHFGGYDLSRCGERIRPAAVALPACD